jgi:hypothetical protein
MATIRLLVSYDQAINNDRSGRYTLPGTITTVAADATRIFTNSQANIQLQVVGTLFLNINDTVSNGLRDLLMNGFGDLKTLRQQNNVTMRTRLTLSICCLRNARG